MPVPTPQEGESQQQFVSRCIRTLSHLDPNRDPKQIQAICFSQWRREDMHSDFQRILALFTTRYSLDDGLAKFIGFIENNKLDVAKAYNPLTQFHESFQWVHPLITFYAQDNEAKYYKVTALTANISMNNNDYSDFEKMQRAAPTLAYRPVNLNHDHSKWLPFPRTRVDFTKAEDLSIEAILRVDNQDEWLQQMLDKKQILHPSIEGRPEPEGMGEGYHLTGLALIQTGVDLPGDPLTEIQPLFLHESIGKQICKIIDGKLICEDNCNTENKNIGEMKKTLSTQQETFGDASFPDSCFAYVPDSAKGPDGNKSDRKLPYKNPDGTVDLPHVRNALARLDQTEGIPAEKKAQIRTMLQNILKRESPEYKPTEEDLKLEVHRLQGEASKLKAEKSELELDKFNLKEDLETEQAKNKTLDEQITRQKLEFNKIITEQKATIDTQVGQLAEKEKHLINANKKIDAKTTEITENIGHYEEKLTEKNVEIQTLTAKHETEIKQVTSTMKKQLEETIQSRDDNQALADNLKRQREEDVIKLREYIQENLELNNALIDERNDKLELSKKLKEAQTLIERARKYQKWSHKELEKAGIIVIEEPAD